MTVTFQKRWTLKIFFHLRWGRFLKASSSLLKISFTVFINSLFSLSDWHWWPQTTKWHTWPTRQVMCEWWKFVYSIFFLINVFTSSPTFFLTWRLGRGSTFQYTIAEIKSISYCVSFFYSSCSGKSSQFRTT